MKPVQILFEILIDDDTGGQRFRISDNGGELEASEFDTLKEAIDDIDNRVDHYMLTDPDRVVGVC